MSRQCIKQKGKHRGGTDKIMRYFHKKQCFETIRLLNEAHGQIIKSIEKKQTEQALTLLEQCQEGAIGIGTAVESAEGEGNGTEIIRCLEEYCEVVYRFHEALLQGDAVNTWQIQKKLRKLLLKAENLLRYNVPAHREVVFLPYKASMWDSLESVWKAASEDPDCTALVIPIPYYDKNPDGSFREMHYEIGRFPADVPVVRYDAYDFETRHPDMIFIHNPYDNGNHVTSVHPFFYSKNLKSFTDELVYIPYFILGDIDPANGEAVKKMEHFCLTEGVVNADHVIVQSESMKQVYVDVLTRYTSEKERPWWEQKILGLGSPKVDRVCSLRREDFEIPEEWERVIYREDGSRKKVIFYNTSVDAFLKKDTAMLEKIRENLRIFQENRENVTLLWRPHPLMEATLTSMRPELYPKYREMVQEYRTAGFGIFDDSANMDRAIAISDAYYGDWSSIVWLYKQTGKPVMIQNVEVRTDMV